MNRTAESIIKKMESTGIMTRTHMTSKERLDGLCAYQALALQEIFNDQHATNLRFKDGIQHINHLAKEKGLTNSPVIKQAIADMKMLSKEIAIAISGQSGEQTVSRSISYTNRHIIAIPNVTLCDDEHKSELDQVIVTSNGILILEVKNHKTDIMISETGCICTTANRPLSDKCLGDQMNRKRYLLRSKLEKALQDTQMNIPVHIDSFVVFSSSFVTVTDKYRQEKYCFSASLPHEIEQYCSDVSYTDEQMETLSGIIRGIAEEEEAYYVDMDFDKIRKTFAATLVLLESDPVLEDCNQIDTPVMETDQDDIDLDAEDEEYEDDEGDDTQDQGLSAVGRLLLTGVAVVGATIFVRKKLNIL